MAVTREESLTDTFRPVFFPLGVIFLVRMAPPVPVPEPVHVPEVRLVRVEVSLGWGGGEGDGDDDGEDIAEGEEDE